MRYPSFSMAFLQQDGKVALDSTPYNGDKSGVKRAEPGHLAERNRASARIPYVIQP